VISKRIVEDQDKKYRTTLYGAIRFQNYSFPLHPTQMDPSAPPHIGMMPQPMPQQMMPQQMAQTVQPPPYQNNCQAPQPVIMAQPQPMIINNAAPPQNTCTTNTIVIGDMGKTKSELVLIPMEKLQRRSWGTGLFGCLMDVTSCFCGMFMLPCLACRVANRMGECALVPFCGGVVAMRTKLRTMGGIKGSIHSDCINSFCCYACVMCQMEREINAMKL